MRWPLAASSPARTRVIMAASSGQAALCSLAVAPGATRMRATTPAANTQPTRGEITAQRMTQPGPRFL